MTQDVEWETHEFANGTRIRLPQPFSVPESFEYVEPLHGLLNECRAAWETEGVEQPMHLLFSGPPGCGKNSLSYKLSQDTGKRLYLLLGHEELDSQDIVVSPVIREDSRIEYLASPLLAALITGNIVLFDEISKCRPRALAVLSSLLDGGVIHSDVLGHTFKAHPEFRFIAAMNPTDADAYVLPKWLQRRLNVRIELENPPWNILRKIVATRLSAPSPSLNFIEGIASSRNIELSPPELNDIVSYAQRLNRALPNMVWEDAVERAFMRILGVDLSEEAADAST